MRKVSLSVAARAYVRGAEVHFSTGESVSCSWCRSIRAARRRLLSCAHSFNAKHEFYLRV